MWLKSAPLRQKQQRGRHLSSARIQIQTLAVTLGLWQMGKTIKSGCPNITDPEVHSATPQGELRYRCCPLQTNQSKSTFIYWSKKYIMGTSFLWSICELDPNRAIVQVPVCHWHFDVRLGLGPDLRLARLFSFCGNDKNVFWTSGVLENRIVQILKSVFLRHLKMHWFDYSKNSPVHSKSPMITWSHRSHMWWLLLLRGSTPSALIGCADGCSPWNGFKRRGGMRGVGDK